MKTDTSKQKKATHTPGPWAVQIDNPLATIPGHTIKTAHGVGLPVGIIHAHRGSKGPFEGIANACLIAAAPDLLAALEKAIRDIENPEEIHARSRHTLSLATQQMIRAAIAKALGN